MYRSNVKNQGKRSRGFDWFLLKIVSVKNSHFMADLAPRQKILYCIVILYYGKGSEHRKSERRKSKSWSKIWKRSERRMSPIKWKTFDEVILPMASDLITSSKVKYQLGKTFDVLISLDFSDLITSSKVEFQLA